MPPPGNRVFRVTILGRQYAFASQGEEGDRHIQRVAELVDEKMRQVQRDTGTQAPVQTAVLAGLEFVDELLRLRGEVTNVEENISERASRLTESLGRIFRQAETVEAPDASDGTPG